MQIPQVKARCENQLWLQKWALRLEVTGAALGSAEQNLEHWFAEGL